MTRSIEGPKPFTYGATGAGFKPAPADPVGLFIVAKPGHSAPLFLMAGQTDGTAFVRIIPPHAAPAPSSWDRCVAICCHNPNGARQPQEKRPRRMRIVARSAFDKVRPVSVIGIGSHRPIKANGIPLVGRSVGHRSAPKPGDASIIRRCCGIELRIGTRAGNTHTHRHADGMVIREVYRQVGKRFGTGTSCNRIVVCFTGRAA